MAFVDWLIIIVFFIILVIGALYSRSYNKSVADFLAANRCAGRYILSISGSMSAWGAITFIAIFQVYHRAGFTADWWYVLWRPLGIILAISGWVLYRYRQTRTFTVAQFFEMRYNKSFRIFAGILAYISGILNFGIFPGVASRFFVSFCGLPATVSVFGLSFSTFILIMFGLLVVALIFTFIGGQITILFTDFLQGLFGNIIFLAVLIFFMVTFDWSFIVEGLNFAAEDASRFQPLKTGKIESFNVWFFLIGAFSMFYNRLGWQGSQGYRASALNAHEAKMSGILQQWSFLTQQAVLLLPCICIWIILNNPEFLNIQNAVNAGLDGITNEQIADRLIIPLGLRNVLPIGLTGAFVAAMFAAFLSTHDSYLHSFGSIFIQDVILPLRKKPLTPKQHIRLLRLSVTGVAVFIFFYSIFFNPEQDILLYMAITGSIFLGGAGAVIIGGLYWTRGTTAGAFSALIFGAVCSVIGIILPYLYENFPFNGQQMFFFAMILSSLIYVIVSLLSSCEKFNMDKMLHRGKYAAKDEGYSVAPAKTIRERLGITSEFTFSDKVIAYSLFLIILCYWLFFLAVTFTDLAGGITEQWWLKYWRFRIWFIVVVTSITTIWFSIGGIKNAFEMFNRLKKIKLDEYDDGRVVDGHNLADEINKEQNSEPEASNRN